MKEIYVETKVFFNKKGLSDKINYSTVYLGLWWAMWIISVFVASFVLISAFGHDDSIDGLIAYTIVNMVTNILGIPLALLNIKIVKDYSKIEPLLREVNDDEETIANIIV